mmetsp:Transcript_21822/g.47528  ORF Transcript_21822/g.47528 Transcript_21822/m.47528 type:complete len:200 (-) Transcript_21822:543-1142(-)
MQVERGRGPLGSLTCCRRGQGRASWRCLRRQGRRNCRGRRLNSSGKKTSTVSKCSSTKSTQLRAIIKFLLFALTRSVATVQEVNNHPLFEGEWLVGGEDFGPPVLSNITKTTQKQQRGGDVLVWHDSRNLPKLGMLVWLTQSTLAQTSHGLRPLSREGLTRSSNAEAVLFQLSLSLLAGIAPVRHIFASPPRDGLCCFR